MKTLAPLAIGDRVSNAILAKHRHAIERFTGKVTNLSPLMVRWDRTGQEQGGYRRDELHKLPAMRCHCPDCDRKTQLPDGRYTVAKVFCGHAERHWLAYFCNEAFGSSHPSRCGAARACFDHSKARGVAL